MHLLDVRALLSPVLPTLPSVWNPLRVTEWGLPFCGGCHVKSSASHVCLPDGINAAIACSDHGLRAHESPIGA